MTTGTGYSIRLHNARLDFELHAEILQRALGRGGAPVDFAIARTEIAEAIAALQRVAELLGEKRPSTAPRRRGPSASTTTLVSTAECASAEGVTAECAANATKYRNTMFRKADKRSCPTDGAAAGVDK